VCTEAELRKVYLREIGDQGFLLFFSHQIEYWGCQVHWVNLQIQLEKQLQT
jgi:hypothetical protein